MRKQRKINFKYNLREFWSLVKKQKAYFIALIVITFITEALFVADKYLFKIIVDDGTKFLDGTLTQNIFVQTLMIIGAIFLGIVIVRSVGKWLTVHFVNTMDSRLILNLKEKYFNHILDLSHSFHTTHKTGSMISRLLRGAGALENMADIIVFNFVPLVFNLIVVGFSLAYFGIAPAVVLALTVVVFISYSYWIQHIQQRYRLRHNTAEDKEKGMIGDMFTNIDSIKYLGKEDVVKTRFKRKITTSKNTFLKWTSYFRWFDAGQILILGVGLFFLIFFPLKTFLAGNMTIGTLVFIFTVYGNVTGPMFGFVWGMRGFYRSMADFQYLFEYGKVKNEIKDKKNAPNLQIEKGTLEFKNVDFSYGKRKFLKKFNLKIKANEKVALVGHSGCGKTTIVKLINRFYDVDSGSILIDNEDIRNFKQESVRSQTGIVPQECILFDDTIYNNIKFARLNATHEEVMKAIKLAQLDKIIENFPKGEKTIVGERGVKLSGGEKQRVSIARSILANKKILVLDEATSALDSETEHEIQKALKELLKGRTSIIIAHRLSTIMSADRIIVMENGKIIQQGKHDELIKEDGEYKKLWNFQKGGYLED